MYCCWEAKLCTEGCQLPSPFHRNLLTSHAPPFPQSCDNGAEVLRAQLTLAKAKIVLLEEAARQVRHRGGLLTAAGMVRVSSQFRRDYICQGSGSPALCWSPRPNAGPALTSTTTPLITALTARHRTNACSPVCPGPPGRRRAARPRDDDAHEPEQPARSAREPTKGGWDGRSSSVWM